MVIPFLLVFYYLSLPFSIYIVVFGHTVIPINKYNIIVKYTNGLIIKKVIIAILMKSCMYNFNVIHKYNTMCINQILYKRISILYNKLHI